MLKFVYMGSPPFAGTILKALIAEKYFPQLVVTQNAKPAGRGRKLTETLVAAFSRTKEIEVLETADVNNAKCLALLRSKAPDLLVVVAFGQILKETVLNLPKLFSLNVHASLLPKFRGAAPIQRSIWNGDNETGVTIQKMTRKLDAGDILLQKRLPIASSVTAGELTTELAELGAKALIEALRLIESGQYQFIAQDESKATLAPKISKQDALIDWAKPQVEIYNQIRALNPWPGAETWCGNDVLKIHTASMDMIHPIPRKSPPGAVTTNHRDFLYVHTGDRRAIALTEVQLVNRKKLGIKSFLSAYKGNFPFNALGKLENQTSENK